MGRVKVDPTISSAGKKKHQDPVHVAMRLQHEFKKKKKEMQQQGKRRVGTGTPPGYHLFMVANSGGAKGLCDVLAKNNMEDGEQTREHVAASPSFLVLNDKGSRGLPIAVSSDALSVFDGALTTVVDKLLLDITFAHYQLAKNGLVTTANTGVILHPDEEAAQGRELSDSTKFVITPRTISLSIQCDPSLREIFSDLKLPGDMRPVLVYQPEPQKVTNVVPGAPKAKTPTKRTASDKLKTVQEAHEKLQAVCAEYGIKV